jgi:GNAT superfamily N-acetyltransferase
VPGFKIRRATLTDMGVLSDHRNAMFEEYAPLTPEERAVAVDAYPAWAREMMKKKRFHGYIVETRGGKVAASGCVWLRAQQPSRGRPATLIPYVMSVYTHPNYRRKGLASMIMLETMAWSKKHGYRKMLLHASTAGRKVYSQLGWKRTWEMDVDLKSPKVVKVMQAKPRRPSKPSRASK